MEENNFEPTEYDIEQAEHEAEIYDEDNTKNKIPPLIFKFRSLDDRKLIKRAIEIIKGKKFYMPTRKQLNDPFEGGNVKYISPENIGEFNDKINKSRILALSRNCFSAPLWAHYASECTGICFGFHTDKSFNCIQKIVYADTIEKKQWFSTEINDAINREFIYKYKDWEYEDEYRIIREPEQNEETCYMPFDTFEMAVIIFGSKIDPKKKKKIKKVIPKHCIQFDVIPDAEKSRYFLKECDSDASPIYELEELYKRIGK